ncbi:Protein of unknown function [Propionibacterium freudenreichii]|nr:Protein of unknown function [Propionibacterium freudenreichii]CEH05844.1 Protein of unknown function [Propionibacterium freudenreichii]CEI31698.1 Protein of unknown function [Propionibacterium freudenreichii]CEI50161.1 Protein of unknown function [Propionibacterium freudenreichii]
MMIRLSLG